MQGVQDTIQECFKASEQTSRAETSETERNVIEEKKETKIHCMGHRYRREGKTRERQPSRRETDRKRRQEKDSRVEERQTEREDKRETAKQKIYRQREIIVAQLTLKPIIPTKVELKLF